jgi:hypothetical protein
LGIEEAPDRAEVAVVERGADLLADLLGRKR